MEKHYRSSVRSDSDDGELPEVVEFSIDEATARDIVRLSTVVTANGLLKVEKSDRRARYYEHELVISLEAPGAEVDDNEAWTRADCLVVSETEFWFSAVLKHCDVEILSERQRIAELTDFFGIRAEAQMPADGQSAPVPTESPSPADKRDEAREFVNQVAALSIWSYDDKDGEPYRECRPPSDGYLDSHYCLMDLIEQARSLREGQ